MVDNEKDIAWLDRMLDKLQSRASSMDKGEAVMPERAFLDELQQDMTRRKAIAWKLSGEREMKAAFSRLPDPLMAIWHTQEDLDITLEQLVLLAAYPDLKNRFVREVQRRISSIRSIGFTFDESLCDIPASVALPSDLEVVSVSTSLGLLFGSLPNLETAKVCFARQEDLTRNVLLATVFLGCRQIKKLTVRHVPGESETLQQILAYIQDHPLLERLMFHLDLEDEVIDNAPFLRAVASLPRLSVLHIEGARINGTQEGLLLQEVLEKETLKTVHLNHFSVEAEAEMDLICDGLAESKFTELRVDLWHYPESKCARLANALISSQVVDLTVIDSECNNQSFHQTLSQRLSECRDGSVKKLCVECLFVENFNYQSSVTALLENANCWTVQELKLSLPRLFKWTDEMDRALCNYVANNMHLRRLTLDCIAPNGNVARLLSPPFTEAVGSGKGSLDMIDLEFSGDISADELHIKERKKWAQTLKQLVASNLNRQRRVFGALFLKASRAESESSRLELLSKALSAVDAKARFAFLWGNEWHARDLLMSVTAPRISPKKRRLNS
jgi:hypothetical protein